MQGNITDWGKEVNSAENQRGEKAAGINPVADCQHERQCVGVGKERAACARS